MSPSRPAGRWSCENPYVTSELPLPRTDTADLTVQATVRNVTDTAAGRRADRQG